jgi:hypothetical protein
MIKYRVWGGAITPVEVVRETEKSVFLTKSDLWGGAIGATKEAKRSDFQNWFDTWKDAHEFILLKQEKRVYDLEGMYEFAVRNLERIRAMQDPTGGQE